MTAIADSTTVIGMGTNHFLVWHHGSLRDDASIVIATQPGDAARAYVATAQCGSIATRVFVQPFSDRGSGKVIVLDVFGNLTAPPVACHSCGVLVPILLLRCDICADIGHSVECYTVEDVSDAATDRVRGVGYDMVWIDEASDFGHSDEEDINGDDAVSEVN